MRTINPVRLAAAAILVLAAASSAQSRSLLPAEDRVLRSMSDANILGHLASVDSFEVALSDTAIMKSKSDTVLRFAREMRTAHLAARTQARTLGRELGVPLTTIANEMKRTHMFAPADSVSIGSEVNVDRHYITQQIEMHDHMLAELNVLQDVARDERVKANVRARIPVVQGHLDYAKSVAKAKGIKP